MNQKSLFITIVAVVAVIVLGLWLSGALQSGPLTGCINCQNTNLTLSVGLYISDRSPTGHVLTFQGSLTNQTGTPLPFRTVFIYKNGNPPTSAVNTITQSNGEFIVNYIEEGGSQEYYALFPGDDKQYLGSQSSIVSSPPWL